MMATLIRKFLLGTVAAMLVTAGGMAQAQQVTRMKIQTAIATMTRLSGIRR